MVSGEWRSATVIGRNIEKKAGHTAQVGVNASSQMVAVLEAANASTASDAAVFMVTAHNLDEEEARDVRGSEGNWERSARNRMSSDGMFQERMVDCSCVERLVGGRIA